MYFLSTIFQFTQSGFTASVLEIKKITFKLDIMQHSVLIRIYIFLILGLFACLQGFAQNVIVSTNDSWKYLDNGSDQGTAWRMPNFNDANWLAGNAELGYGDNPTTTLNSSQITYYFRKEINISNLAQYVNFRMNFRRDDGIIIYINGTELLRNYIDNGSVNYQTLAITDCRDDGNLVLSTLINKNIFQEGQNTIACEVHNVSTSSSDITFELELIGNLSTATPQLLRGAYMTMATNNSITISWRTDVPCNSEVKIGSLPSQLISYATNNALVTDHAITVTGLQPNTRYYYSVGTVGTELQNGGNNFFWTAPNTGAIGKYRFLVTGDMGDGGGNQTQVRDAFTNYTNSSATHGWIWLGDNAYYNGTDLEYQSFIFNIYAQQLKYLCLFPALGNHDYANVGYLSNLALTNNFPYFDIFTLPTNSGNEKYYSYNYGNIHFITLDSYGALNSPGSPMYTWLQNDLQSNTQRFTIVNFHHPPYTKGTHNSDTEIEDIDIRQNIVPLLEQHGVDLVMCGHSHTYERSKFIKGHQGVSTNFNNAIYPAGNVVMQPNGISYYKNSTKANGTIYVVCGSSGRKSTSVSTGFPHNAMQTSMADLGGCLILDIEGDSLYCKFITAAGSTFDEFAIVKKQGGTTAINTDSHSAETITNYYDISLKSLEISVPSRFTNTDNNKLTLKIYNIRGEQELDYSAFANSNSDTKLSIPQNSLPNKAGVYFITLAVGKNIIHRDKIIFN